MHHMIKSKFWQGKISFIVCLHFQCVYAFKSRLNNKLMLEDREKKLTSISQGAYLLTTQRIDITSGLRSMDLFFSEG